MQCELVHWLPPLVGEIKYFVQLEDKIKAELVLRLKNIYREKTLCKVDIVSIFGIMLYQGYKDNMI